MNCLEDCKGACCNCSLSAIPLRPKEAKGLTDAGTRLVKTGFTSGVPEGMDEYARFGGCGINKDGLCPAHEQPHTIDIGPLGLFQKKIEQPEFANSFLLEVMAA